jgi:hypothetical protein
MLVATSDKFSMVQLQWCVMRLWSDLRWRAKASMPPAWMMAGLLCGQTDNTETRSQPFEKFAQAAGWSRVFVSACQKVVKSSPAASFTQILRKFYASFTELFSALHKALLHPVNNFSDSVKMLGFDSNHWF